MSKQMKRRIFFPKLIGGKKLKILAYSIGQGLWVHPHITADFKLTKEPNWTISLDCGMALSTVWDETLDRVIAACEKLKHLDWSMVDKIKNDVELKPYKKAKQEFEKSFFIRTE